MTLMVVKMPQRRRTSPAIRPWCQEMRARLITSTQKLLLKYLQMMKKWNPQAVQPALPVPMDHKTLLLRSCSMGWTQRTVHSHSSSRTLRCLAVVIVPCRAALEVVLAQGRLQRQAQVELLQVLCRMEAGIASQTQLLMKTTLPICNDTNMCAQLPYILFLCCTNKSVCRVQYVLVTNSWYSHHYEFFTIILIY